MSGVEELAEKYKDSKPVRSVIAMHAYESTVLMGLLEKARGGPAGKDDLPPNWFLWLKGVDRKLWYALADVGRQTYHPESGGVGAHWLAERARRKALQMPFVRTAVDGLKIELGKLTADGDLDEEDGMLKGAPEMVIKSAAPRKIPTPEEAEQQRLARAKAGTAPPRIEDFPFEGK